MIKEFDLKEVIGTEITGIMVNPSSVSLSFSDVNRHGGWILMQCRFALQMAGECTMGNATAPELSASLLGCLKKKIVDAHFNENKILTLYFEDDNFLQFIPEKDGLESYVLHTVQGIFPVVDF
jgi:hypothetical protein